MANSVLKLRIVVVDPLPNVAVAMQRGQTAAHDLVPAHSVSPSRITFEFEVEVADAAKVPPRLVGKFAQGPADARFVYINWGTSAGQFGSPWTRRAKIPLRGITAKMIASLLKNPAHLLEASIRGTAKDGGPACATVPFLSDWVETEQPRGPGLS